MSPEPELLEGVHSRDAAEILALAAPISLAAGAMLFRLGAEAHSLYLIDAGRIVLTMPMRVGGAEEDVLIDERQPGQTLGWSTLIPPHRFTLDASAPVASVLLAFPRERLLRYFDRRPEVGYVVSRNLAAVVGHRLQVFQAMWLRQMQHIVKAAAHA